MLRGSKYGYYETKSEVCRADRFNKAVRLIVHLYSRYQSLEISGGAFGLELGTAWNGGA